MTAAEQVRVLMQGTEYGDDALKAGMARELEERLVDAERAGRPLRVYCGFDPRTADLHIGHAVPIRKLRQFQDLGHEVTVVVGTGTAPPRSRRTSHALSPSYAPPSESLGRLPGQGCRDGAPTRGVPRCHEDAVLRGATTKR